MASLKNDEHALLQKNNHNLRFATKVSDAPLGFSEAISHAWQMCAVFVLVLFACTTRWFVLALLCAALAVALLAWNAGKLWILVASVVGPSAHRAHMRRPSLVFWMWWPTCTCVGCAVALALGAMLGVYLWRNNFKPYYELAELERYRGIGPSVTSGSRVQDAGLITFDVDADLDRQHGGCYVTRGHTYCVAPVVDGGHVASGLADSPRTGSYDFFAVGIDCCTCPGQDFQCGSWRDPLAQGGLRSLDFRSRPFYQLAVDDWMATYDKVSEKPLFFDWVADPEAQWHFLWEWAANIVMLACAGFIAFGFFAALLLEWLLRVLVRHDLASAVGVPLPPQGLGWVWEKMMPGAHQHYMNLVQQHQASLAPKLGRSVPASANHWYGAAEYIPCPPPYQAQPPLPATLPSRGPGSEPARPPHPNVMP